MEKEPETDGRTIISQKPDFDNRQFSEAQLNTRSRTRQAAAYAKTAKSPWTKRLQGTCFFT
jgi:hypothetical protein